MKSRAYILLSFTGLFLLFLAGCDSESTSDGGVNGPSDGDDVMLSISVVQALAVVADSATATLTPGGHNSTLTISGNTVSGAISSVPPGTYTLTITYTTGTTLIATATKESISVTAGGSTVIAVLESDLVTDYDNDNDGFTNLAEIRIGTDPDNDVNTPDGGSPAFSAGNGSFGTATTSGYEFSVVVGEAVVGSYDTVTNNATDYAMVAGFKGFQY